MWSNEQFSKLGRASGNTDSRLGSTATSRRRNGLDARRSEVRIGPLLDEPAQLNLAAADAEVEEQAVFVESGLGGVVCDGVREFEPEEFDGRIEEAGVDSGRRTDRRKPAVRADDQPTPHHELLAGVVVERADAHDLPTFANEVTDRRVRSIGEALERRRGLDDGFEQRWLFHQEGVVVGPGYIVEVEDLVRAVVDEEFAGADLFVVEVEDPVEEIHLVEQAEGVGLEAEATELAVEVGWRSSSRVSTPLRARR